MTSTLVRGAGVGPAPVLDPLGRSILGGAAMDVPAVVVAIHGRKSAAAALRVASELARRDGEPLEVLTIEEQLASGVKGFCLDAASLNGDVVRDSGVLGSIRAQLLEVLGDEGWRLHVEFGRVAPAVARAAIEMQARIIVVGLGSGGPTERVFGRETAARVLRYATVPVLAVHPTASGLPHRAAVALDFSEPSLRAARAVAALVEPPAVLYLLHVSSGADAAFPESEGWKKVFDAGVHATFERLERDLARRGLTVESRLLEGGVSETLARFARDEKLDVIAAGSHSHEIVDRLLLGSVPAQLLRGAECSVLVAPPVEAVA